ncbi:Single-stranded DNA-binding protein, mitochondrial [Amphibalanus amphitrite]|uniref:Single-stranded DNA-binding protein, mitochondrial n=1 Tax=Amphibalanus amphitrite TaxID=1232801 RepID=A0A6A4VP99_AMPAM|nr:Single-stranded DNA-binding protein, mitochondrial [Amphibalanus amphitrite]
MSIMNIIQRTARKGPQLAQQARTCYQGAYGEKCLNSVTLLGRAGSVAQKRGTPDSPVVIFSLATNSYHKNAEGDVTQHVQWHRISVFRPSLRETVFSNLAKGQRVLVRGSISYYTVQDNYNNTSTATSIIADDVIFLSRTREGSYQASDETADDDLK